MAYSRGIVNKNIYGTYAAELHLAIKDREIKKVAGEWMDLERRKMSDLT